MGEQASMGVKEHGPLGCASCCCLCLCLGFSLPMITNYDIHGSGISGGYTTGLWGSYTWSTDALVASYIPGDGYNSYGFADCPDGDYPDDSIAGASCSLLTTQRLYTATFTFAILALFASGAGMAMKMINWIGAVLHFLVALLALCTVGYITSKNSDGWGTTSLGGINQDIYPSFSYVILWFAVLGHLSAMGGSIMAALAKDDLDPADLEPATEEIGADQAVTAKV